MNCEEALSLLYDIIDKEASQIDIRQVEDHLKKCRHCFDKYELEKSIQTFISTHLKRQESLPALDNLRARVAEKLDEVDAAGTRKTRRSAFGIATLTLASAATLTIAIAAAFVISAFVRHNREYAPFEHAHAVAESDPAGHVAGNNPGNSVRAWVRDNLSYDLDNQVNGFNLLGGSTEEISGVSVRHFVYSSGKTVVSVFVVPSDRFSIPDDLKQTEVVRNSLHFFDHHCRGCRLVFHRVGAAVIITATTDPAVELFDFVPGRAAA